MENSGTVHNARLGKSYSVESIKIERGGFGKSAKSKKVMQSDSVNNSQNAFDSTNTLQLNEKELGNLKLELCLFVVFVIIPLLLIFTVLRYIL